MENFNYHFDEKVIQKDTNYTEFRKGVEALSKRWRKQLEESVLLIYL